MQYVVRVLIEYMLKIITEILSHSYFKDFFLPLLSAMITICVKVVSRKDTFMGFTREDFAIGFDISITALILLLTSATKCATDIKLNLQSANAVSDELRDKLAVLPWILFIYVALMWAVSTLVRARGWDTQNNNRPTMFWGIIVPDFFGVVSLLTALRFFQ
jgi:hypothetical protein